MLPDQLPASFAGTREGLRALACYVIAPVRKALTGRIGLRPIQGGLGTPELPDGTRIVVRGDRLAREPGDSVRITSLEAAAEFLSVKLSSDPGVGSELPPFEPTRDLGVEQDAALALGAWYAVGDHVLAGLDDGTKEVSEAQLWPEHFDLAVEVTLSSGRHVNVGFSPGDAEHADPYVYVGPHDRAGLAAPYWNAPFGALLGYGDLVAASSAEGAARRFIAEGINLVQSSR